MKSNMHIDLDIYWELIISNLFKTINDRFLGTKKGYFETFKISLFNSKSD
jgi:hypothetical protein